MIPVYSGEYPLIRLCNLRKAILDTDAPAGQNKHQTNSYKQTANKTHNTTNTRINKYIKHALLNKLHECSRRKFTYHHTYWFLYYPLCTSELIQYKSFHDNWVHNPERKNIHPMIPM